MSSTPVEGDEGAGSAGDVASTPVSHERPAPDEPRRRVGLLTHIVRSLSPETLAAEDAKAAAAGMTLAAWIERRNEEIKRTLVRDNAPVALRELRKIQRGETP